MADEARGSDVAELQESRCKNSKVHYSGHWVDCEHLNKTRNDTKKLEMENQTVVVLLVSASTSYQRITEQTGDYLSLSFL